MSNFIKMDGLTYGIKKVYFETTTTPITYVLWKHTAINQLCEDLRLILYYKKVVDHQGFLKLKGVREN